MNKENCFQIGYIARTHGVDGGVIIKTENQFPEDIENEGTVFLEIEGLLVPFFISEQGISFRNETSIFTNFDDIAYDNEAAELIGSKVFIERNTILKQNTTELKKTDLLVGYMLIDNKLGQIGKIDAIIRFPKNSVFQVFHGKKEILIPNEPKLILSTNHETQTLLMSLPEGLIAIYLEDNTK